MSVRVNINYLSNFIIILSIILFYIFPFVILEASKIYKYHKSNISRLIIIFAVIILILFIDKFLNDNFITYYTYGGGVLLKLSQILEVDTELFLSFFAFISLLILDYLFEEKRLKNYLIFLLLVLSFPLPVIYQKYIDPLFT